MSTESRVLDFLLSSLVPPENLFTDEDLPTAAKAKADENDPQVEPIHTETFEDLIGVYHDNGLFVPRSVEDTLAVMLATTISTHIGGDERLWFYVKGPPSSGKSLLCSSVGADKTRCMSIDKFTGFMSGFRQGKSKREFGLLDEINHRTVVIKDFTSILSQPMAIQEKIFGELRFLSDGTASGRWLNGKSINRSNVRFSMLCGVTDEILYVNRSGLGERFLMVDITDKHHGSQEHVKKALTSIGDTMLSSFPQQPEDDSDKDELQIPKDRLHVIKQHTAGFMNHIHKRFRHMRPPVVDDEFYEHCSSIGRFVGIVRGQVKREGVGRDLVYVPRPEIGVRLGAQLLKTAISLGVVFQKERLDKKVLRIIRKVSHDTASGYNFEIVSLISKAMQSGEIGLDKDLIAGRLDISPSDVQRRLDDLRVLKLLTRVGRSNNSGRGGRNRHYWRLNEEYTTQWEHLAGKPRTAN